MTALPLELILYTGAIGLVAIGAVGLVASTHLFRMLLALALAEGGGNLLLVLAGYRWDAVAPILTAQTLFTPMVDPVPQAMVLTAIVIGVGVQAFAVAVLLKIKRAYGTLEMYELRRLMEREIAEVAGIAPSASLDSPHGERPLPNPVVSPEERS